MLKFHYRSSTIDLCCVKSYFSDNFTKITSNTMVCVRESSKPILYSKWGHFDRAKSILKILLVSWTLGTVEKGFRSFNSENLRSVGQMAAKFLAIKHWEWFDPRRSRIWAEGTCTLFGRKGRRVYKHKVWWLVTLQPFDLQTQIFSIKRSKPFTNCVKSSWGYQNFKDSFCPVKVTSFTT